MVSVPRNPKHDVQAIERYFEHLKEQLDVLREKNEAARELIARNLDRIATAMKAPLKSGAGAHKSVTAEKLESDEFPRVNGHFPRRSGEPLR